MERELPQTITASINLTKIDPQYIFEKDGSKYLNLRLKFTPNSKFGDDYMLTQEVDKNTRIRCKETGDWPKTPILGNGKVWDNNYKAPEPQQQKASNDGDLPF